MSTTHTDGRGGIAGSIGCPVALCPICTLVAMSGEVRPEVVGHLLRAGQELMLAIKAVVDARTNEAGGHDPNLERIEVE